MQHTTGYKYNNFVEAAVNAVKEIIDACKKSRTVKRLIYTASVVAASPLKDDASGYKITMDESCWTSPHLNVPYTNDFLEVLLLSKSKMQKWSLSLCHFQSKNKIFYIWVPEDYTNSKTKSEREILKIEEETVNELEVVTLSCGLVGGRGRLPYPTVTVLMFISQIANNCTNYQSLRYLEELLGKIPIVHIEDVCRAHIFCAETPSVNGRFLCASSYVTSADIARYYQKMYPRLNKECIEEHGREIKWGSKKLEDKGFAYKYSTEKILNDCLEFAKRSGLI
ncbi:putative anthocyanidin reductase ((2R,3R)-flavan-3-ol-forming) [Helianthus anomalus]